MAIHQGISVGNLLLDTSNRRNTKQDSQKAERDAIIAEQGRKLVNLAKDIIEHGLNPFDLPLVVDAEDGLGNFIVIEGNRRLTAINLMLKPELAQGTSLHAAFKKLNKEHTDAIPKVLECVISASRKSGMVWIERKHASGLEGAGTEPWSAMAKARSDALEGKPRPDLDAVNFVLSQSGLDPKTRSILEGSQFNVTTLGRLLEAKEFQEDVGFTIQDGKLVTEQEKNRVGGIFTEIVTIIATGTHNGDKFTERKIDNEGNRREFLDKIIPKHPQKKKAASAWKISGKPIPATLKVAATKVKGTPSTEDQVNLIPKKFRLELPAGKINDIFVEIKELDVTKRRHAVSVLFRVFFEMTLDDYITKHGIQLPKDNKGNVRGFLLDKLNAAISHAKTSSLLSDKELKSINVAVSDKNSFLSPETLNAYVHSQWMNPEPLQLKLAWNNAQLFIERLWQSKK
jgi:hypothetical protein